jgi:predicted MFS family arabinose efflux permease
MNELRRGASPLFAATVGTMCGLTTITTYSQSFFVGAVTSEFGWSFGQFFLTTTIIMCSGLVTAPLIGALVPKFGIRTLGMVGLIGHALCYCLFGINPNSLPLWYATAVLLSFLSAGSLPIIWTAVLNGWFFKKRGLAVGITMSGTGIGAFLLPPIASLLIGDYGWRTAYFVIGLGACALSLPIVYFLFKENTDSTAEEKPKLAWGLSRSEAIKTRRFWALSIVLFLTAFAIIGLVSNFKPIFLSKGAIKEQIALLGLIMGISVLCGRLVVGSLLDKFWAPAVAIGAMMMPLMALLLLHFVPYSFAVGVAIAMGIGIAAGAELDLVAYLTSKYFGPKNYAQIFGAIFALFSIGGGIAPPLFGALSSGGAGYTVPFYLALGALIISVPLFLSLGAYPEEAKAEMH